MSASLSTRRNGKRTARNVRTSADIGAAIGAALASASPAPTEDSAVLASPVTGDTVATVNGAPVTGTGAPVGIDAKRTEALASLAQSLASADPEDVAVLARLASSPVGIRLARLAMADRPEARPSPADGDRHRTAKDSAAAIFRATSARDVDTVAGVAGVRLMLASPGRTMADALYLSAIIARDVLTHYVTADGDRGGMMAGGVRIGDFAALLEQRPRRKDLADALRVAGYDSAK